MLAAFSLTAAAPAPGTNAEAWELARAKEKIPRPDFKGHGQTMLSKVLNGHLLRQETNTRACADWTPAELQGFLATINEHRSPELQEIYQDATDRRRMLLETPTDYKAHWRQLNEAAEKHPDLADPLRESHCREAVMWWTHHLTDDKRRALRGMPGVVVPLLPESEKRPCDSGAGEDAAQACVGIEKSNSCDWCHSTQADHDAGKPGTTPPDALKWTDGPDDGNPHKWDRTRRCDQDQMPRCQPCEGVGGYAWADPPDQYIKTPCQVVANASSVNMSTVAPPLYPKKWTMKAKPGHASPYQDTLIGWQLKDDPSCFSFFPQNDSIGPLCYRSQMGLGKWYDSEKESARTDYTLDTSSLGPGLPNTTTSIVQKGWQMWVKNLLAGSGRQCVCTNPSGEHCVPVPGVNGSHGPPCYNYIWHWDTFKTAQYLGRELIGVEWLQNHGVGLSGKVMELDHFILWSHHLWTDPVSRRLVRAWKPFNGLQNYDPEGWIDDIEDEEAVFETPPAGDNPGDHSWCKKPRAGDPEVYRIHCDDDGNYDGTPPPPGITLPQYQAQLMAQQAHEYVGKLKAGQGSPPPKPPSA